MDVPQVLAHALERWTSEGLISAEQRAAIEAYEHSRDDERGAPVLVEILTYLGVAAILGALGALLGQVWDDLPFGGRFAIFALLGAGAGLGGAALRNDPGERARRAASILWLVSVVGVGAAAATIAEQAVYDDFGPAALTIGLPAMALGVIYNSYSPRFAQLLGVFGAGLTVSFGFADVVGPGDISSTAAAMTLVAAGGLSIVVATGGWLKPQIDATVIGLLLASLGLLIEGAEGGVWAEFAGLALAAGVLWWSTSIGSTHLLFTGAVGLAAFVIEIVARHFADTISGPVVFLVVGALLIGIAVLISRLRRVVEANDDGR